MSASFKVGCRGYLIGVLQRALGIKDDEIFGAQTFASIKNMQKRFMMEETGQADEKLYRALKLRWPDEFDRCLQVTASFEGTGFGGVNNTDIDGAGVTLGLAGFTTKHGEVQSLITEYISKKPTAINVLPYGMQQSLWELVRVKSARAAWDNWFYGENGRVRTAVKGAVETWGKDADFQQLQLDRILRNFWVPAVKSGITLGLRSPQGFGLMLDIQVQNGGWRTDHQRKYLQESQTGTEGSKLRAIAKVVADSANPRWREDVLKRKMVFATGAGKVHGTFYDLSNYAFEPLR